MAAARYPGARLARPTDGTPRRLETVAARPPRLKTGLLARSCGLWVGAAGRVQAALRKRLDRLEEVAAEPRAGWEPRLSLHLTWGERVALLGHNGAGKSVLVDLLTGAREPAFRQAAARPERPVRRAPPVRRGSGQRGERPRDVPRGAGVVRGRVADAHDREFLSGVGIIRRVELADGLLVRDDAE